MSVCPEELKLVALDRDDIEVVSAHVQDALVRLGDMLWLPREHRFVMALNRFDWMTVVDVKHAAEYRRCRTALRFERVLGCKCRGGKGSSNRTWYRVSTGVGAKKGALPVSIS